MPQLVQQHNTPDKIIQGLYLVLRLLVIFTFVSVFFPDFNPARISSRINEDVSLFTTAVSYSNLTVRFERAFIQQWIEPAVFYALMAAAALIVLGATGSAIGAAMSLGNDRMRHRAHFINIAGAAVTIMGLAIVTRVHAALVASQFSDRLEPLFPGFFPVFLIVSLLLLCVSLAILMLERRGKPELEEKAMMHEKYSLFLLLLPMIVLVFLFNYLPLWGWRYAFFDYTVGGELSRESFVGMKWFTFLFRNSATLRDIGRVMTNTLVMSGLGVLTSWLPMFFAIGLNEMRSSRLRRFVQTVTTLPNFISWVLIYGIALAIFSTDGFLNNFLMTTGLNTSSPVNHLMNADYIWIKMLLWGVWKSIGWSAIIYIAAIAGIDPQLYEAATIDGAGRFAKIRYIIIPSIMPTYLVLLLLAIGGMLSNGLEQYLVFQNPLNRETIEVLDLYVYNIGITEGRIPISTVVSMAKSVISVLLLFAANRTSKLVRGENII